VFPGEEDFGMVPVEVQASGRPVIALARGGALETIVPGKTGVLYEEDSAAGLANAVRLFEASGMVANCTSACIENAARFDKNVFKAGVIRVLHRHGIAMPASAFAQAA
jgi:glycosyltransferase involved in cell wall biosynthesis